MTSRRRRKERTGGSANPNTKGKKFERNVAKLFSKWSGLTLIRTPMSGAWSGDTADITVKGRSILYLAIECKSDESFDWNAFATSSSKNLLDWLGQATSQAKEKTSLTEFPHEPLLTWKINYYGPWVAIRTRLWYELNKDSSVFKTFYINIPHANYTVLRMDEFLDSYSFEEVRDAVLRIHKHVSLMDE